MNFLVHYREDFGKDGRPIETYARSFTKYLRLRHPVFAFGGGHAIETIEQLPLGLQSDFLIDLECSRDQSGRFHWLAEKFDGRCPSAAWFIDSHGHPDLHEAIARQYNHVFFAVWAKRDLFSNHSSAHWLPNATDTEWFQGYKYRAPEVYDFGFHSSKGGLDRGEILRRVCERNNWTFDIREVSRAYTHRWPACAQAMAACRQLFNHGQKHDGPNQRVMESMAMRKVLFTDLDPRDGMSKLFEEGKHFLGYASEDELEEKARWALLNPKEADEIAFTAFKEVCTKHQIIARVESVLEVLNAKP